MLSPRIFSISLFVFFVFFGYFSCIVGVPIPPMDEKPWKNTELYSNPNGEGKGDLKADSLLGEGTIPREKKSSGVDSFDREWKTESPFESDAPEKNDEPGIFDGSVDKTPSDRFVRPERSRETSTGRGESDRDFDIPERTAERSVRETRQDRKVPPPDIDRTPPVIYLNGPNPMAILQGDKFVDPGARAIDDRDGPVKVVASGTVNTARPGTYVRTYTARDRAGNRASKTRTVIVKPKFKPPSGPVLYVDGPGGAGLPNGGSDSNPGTINKPLRTISRANSLVKPGYTVIIRGGIYKETIRPATSGTATKPIVYMGYADEYPNIQGRKGRPISLGGRSYVVLEKLDLYSPIMNYKAVVRLEGRNHTLKNCRIVNPKVKPGTAESPAVSPHVGYGLVVKDAKFITLDGNIIAGWWMGLVVNSSSDVTVRNNIIAGNVHTQVTIGPYAGMSNMNDSRMLRHLYENNIIGGSLTSDGIQTEGGRQGTTARVVNIRGIVIRNNYFYFNAENALDFKSGGDILVEGNIFVGTAGDNDGTGVRRGDMGPNFEVGAPAITQGSQRSSERIIIRKNVFYDNSAGPGIKNRYWMIYNNTIAANNRSAKGHNQYDGSGVVGGWGESVIVNNIIVDNKKVAIATWDGYNSRVDYNLYSNAFGKVMFSRGKGRREVKMDFAAWKKLLKSVRFVKGKDEHSIIADPKFVNVPRKGNGGYPYFKFQQKNYMDPVYAPVLKFSDLKKWFPYDFRLRPGSPAIDAGGFLTKAVNSGRNSTYLRVANSKYFFDGYGISGIKGDLIKIGSAPPVEIKKIDYNRDLIVLTRPLSWKKGEPVSLPYKGKAPDIGAFEY